MKNSMLLRSLVPFLLLIALLYLLWHQLFFAPQREFNARLVGETIPAFDLPTLPPEPANFTERDLIGKVSLLNIWATWCEACAAELPMLMKIKNEYHIPIYSIAYKDNPQTVYAWLRNHSNPYVLTGIDIHGVAIDFGVSGVPETFIISPAGKIVYKQSGIIDESIWENVLLPLVKKYG